MSAPHFLVHRPTQPIRRGDMDALGHVDDTVCFRTMEQARIEGLREQERLGANREESGPAIVNASGTFLVPLVPPGNVETRMYPGRAGRTSLDRRYELDCAGTRVAAMRETAPT